MCSSICILDLGGPSFCMKYGGPKSGNGAAAAAAAAAGGGGGGGCVVYWPLCGWV